MRFRTLLALVVLLLAALPARADVASEEARWRRGVALVMNSLPGGLGMGSAFAVARSGTSTWLVTNHHVIAGSGVLHVWMEGDARATPARVVGQDAELDLALLQAEGLSATPLDLAARGTTRVGRDLAVVGFPRVDAFAAEGMTATVSVQRGIVSALRTRGRVPLIQVDAGINPGNSGGPALDWRSCQVVGVATARMQEAEGIGFLVSVDAVHDLLGHNGAGRATARSTPSPGVRVRRPAPMEAAPAGTPAPPRRPAPARRTLPGAVVLGLIIVALAGLAWIFVAKMRDTGEDDGSRDERPVL